MLTSSLIVVIVVVVDITKQFTDADEIQGECAQVSLHILGHKLERDNLFYLLFT